MSRSPMSRVAASCVAGLFLGFSPTALAHEDPLGCFLTNPSIVISVFRGNGTTGVVGSVSQCEHIFYQAKLQKASDSDSICAFSGGTFSLTTPDGVVHLISSNVPCIGGTTNEGCASAVSSLESDKIPYIVSDSDVSGGFIEATGSYSGGLSHESLTNTPGVSATTSKSTPDVARLCGDANGDNEISASDALLALRAAVHLDECSPVVCDYNGDGAVKTSDALAILRVSVGEEIEPRCCGDLTP